MERNATIRYSVVIGVSLLARRDRSRASLLKLVFDPRSEVVVTSTSKDTTPKYELCSVDGNAQVIHLWLEED